MTQVAVVEDEPLTRRLIERVLGDAGFEVLSYDRGALALEGLRKSSPALLITDVGLPDLSGYELITQLRKEHGFPIMILSGHTAEGDFAKGYAAGADDYLRKPVSLTELVAKCRRLVARDARRRGDGEIEGQKFGRYQVEDWLASGGYGEVYRVRDPQQRQLALKVLRGPCANSPDARMRFLREAYALGNLEHPNVASLVEIGGDGEALFYTMEYVEGPTVAHAAAHGTATHSSQLTGLLRPLADILRALESRGMVHRDLKPSNVILSGGRWDQPVLLDFGLAKREVDESLTLNHEVLGTPGFIPPEALLEGKVDIRGDVFALGVLGLYAITGHPPFPHMTGFRLAMHMQEEPVPLPPGLPTGLAILLADMTRIDAALRPRPQEVLDRLDDLAEMGDLPFELPWLVAPEQAQPLPTKPFRTAPGLH
jgi:CheY-like chemotaxis protein